MNLLQDKAVASHRSLLNFLIRALYRLAGKCRDNLDYSYAEMAYNLILLVRPADVRSVMRLSNLHLERGRDDTAIGVLEHWVKICPDDMSAHMVLADLFGKKGENLKAQSHLDACSTLGPNSQEMLVALGRLNRFQGNLRASSDFFKAALQQKEDPEVLYDFAQNLIDEGDQAAAISILEKVVELSRTFAAPYLSLARSGFYSTVSHAHIGRIKACLANSKLDPNNRIGFHYTLGMIYDQHSLWDEAFTHFRCANDLKREQEPFDSEEIGKRVTKRIKVFDKTLIDTKQGPERNGENLIFVTGMPRSGTTLVEQILSSHQKVRAGGERQDIEALMTQMACALKKPYPECVYDLDDKTVSELVRAYQERIDGLDGQDLRFVDKSLNNAYEIGLISVLFPHAKIIHCMRNRLDTCLSCYFQDFHGVRYACDLHTLGMVYRHYERLMQHWTSMLPGRIFEIQYENLVRDPEPNVRRLLSYCELEWHEACLRPHETKRVVRTVSASQVKSPFYTRSVGKWKNYEKHIGALINAVGTS